MTNQHFAGAGWNYASPWSSANPDTTTYGVCYQSKPCPRRFGNPITDGGVKHQLETDWAGVNGMLAVQRSYTSARMFKPRVPRVGVLNEVWMFAYQRYLSFENGQVTAHREDDRRVSFPVPAQIEAFVESEGHTLRANGTGYYLYSPEQVLDVFDSGGKLLSRWDRSGRSQWLAYNSDGRLSGVRSSFGQQIAFSYRPPSGNASLGVLDSIQLPNGIPITYVVDPSNGLIGRVTFADNSSRHFEYAFQPNLGTPLLRSVTDELQKASTYQYRGDGVAFATQRAGGSDNWSLDDNRYLGVGGIVVTTPTGAQNNLNYGYRAGRLQLLSQSQAAGSGCNISASQLDYDAEGNVIQNDDFIGHRVCSQFAGRKEISRVEGLVNTTACSGVTAPGATLPTGTRKTSTQWHPDWTLQTKLAEPGRITTSVYNGQPDPFAGGALASCAPTSALLPDSKPIAVLCRQVKQATDDADGSLGFSAPLQSTVPAREQRWTYNEFGQVLTHDGPRTDVADITVNVYYPDTAFIGSDPNAIGHTRGDLQQTTNPAGQVTRYTLYDKLGNLLEMIDPNGVSTRHTYDVRQRLTSTTVAGQTTVFDYWPTGLLKRVTQPDQSWVHRDYDDAHRLIRISDNLGNSVTYTLDNMGNRTTEEVKDLSNTLRRTLGRSIDALGRVQQITGRE